MRIAVAKSLNRDYKMNQQQIAKNLGVAQAAVSKYLSNKYSPKIAKIEKLIVSKKLEKEIVRAANNEDKKKVTREIDGLASSRLLVEETMRLI